MIRRLLFITSFLLASTSWAIQLDSMNIPAQDFAFRDAAGKTHHLKEYAGKNLILHFWATWCSSCSKEIPDLVRLSKKLDGKEISFLPVSVDSPDQTKKLKSFLKTLKEPVPFFMVVPTPDAEKYWAWGLPITYFIRDGEIFARAMGAREWDKIQPSDLEKIFKKEK